MTFNIKFRALFFKAHTISYLAIFLILFFGVKPSISAEMSYNMETHDPEVTKYVLAADKANNVQERINNYMLASNAVKKKPLTKDNAMLIASINCIIGKEAISLIKFDVAAKACQKSYHFLKIKNLHKNNAIAFYDLSVLYTLAEVSNDEKAELTYLEEFANTQKKFETSYPGEFINVYNSLSNIYSKNNNLIKANYYKRKALKLQEDKQN